jgi:hypothetical protein
VHTLSHRADRKYTLSLRERDVSLVYAGSVWM